MVCLRMKPCFVNFIRYSEIYRKTMKTAILSFTLILGCIIPTYAQMNRNSKANKVYPTVSFYPNKQKDNLGDYKFSEGLSLSLKEEVWSSPDIPTIGTLPGSSLKKTASAYNMPCFKPQGTFSMRIYKPDPNVLYTILLKKF